MEISPIILAKMLLISFFFSVQAGVIFDVGRATRSYFSCAPKNKKIALFYGLKIPFSRRILNQNSGRKVNRVFENTVIFLSDVFFVFYSGFGLAKINFSYNDGDFRFLTLIAFGVGFLLYYFTFSKIILLAFEFLVFLLKGLVGVVCAIIGKPFLILYNNLVKKIKKIYGKLRLRLEKKRKMVYNVYELVCESENIGKKRVKIKVNPKSDGKVRMRRK